MTWPRLSIELSNSAEPELESYLAWIDRPNYSWWFGPTIVVHGVSEAGDCVPRPGPGRGRREREIHRGTGGRSAEYMQACRFAYRCRRTTGVGTDPGPALSDFLAITDAQAEWCRRDPEQLTAAAETLGTAPLTTDDDLSAQLAESRNCRLRGRCGRETAGLDAASRSQHRPSGMTFGGPDLRQRVVQKTPALVLARRGKRAVGPWEFRSRCPRDPDLQSGNLR